jgi:superfamily II DNA or RNA helicase
VKSNELLHLTEGISSWAELETRIANLPVEIERGEAFEQFCKAYFCLDPVFQAEKVYRQNEITHSLREKLGYPGIQDIGIDGLFVTNDGKLFAYQAKFRSDRNNTPTLRELSTFFTMSDKADWRITITNANRLPTSIDERTRHSRVLSDRLYSLDPDFFNRLRVYLEDQSINPPKRKIPNKTQQEVIDKALSYFRENTRGQLILPCGTGKTLASMWIAEKLKAQCILILVPSLALLSQTLREWAFNTSITPFRYLCLCSDTTVDLGNDSPIEHLYEMNIPVTTDAETVSEFLKKNPSSPSILFTTYQSSKVLSTAAIKTGTTFDIAIFDEVHRTTGAKAGVWNIAIDDKKVPVKHRVFMTATPRIYAPHITKKAKENDVLLCSMDDYAIYGKPFFEMTFGEAIARGHITDYKVVVICVTDAEVREIIRRGGKVITDDEHEWDANAFAKRVALIKGINKYNLKRVFTFHSRVNGAKAFTDTKTPYGIEKVFSMILPDNAKQVKAFHVNGTMSSGIRSSLLKEFEQAEIGIMSNARCLTEGVDIPDVDTVAFIDPKKSLIDIVQATGRAMRTAEWKERGYIFIPVIVDENADPEQFIESSDFDAVWQVLQAMVDQDQRLADVVSDLRIMQGKGEEDSQSWIDAMTEYSERVDFYNLPIKVHQERFIKTLHTKTLEVIGKTWDFWYGLTLKYKEQFGDANAPAKYKTPEGFNLGIWQTSQRREDRKIKLSSDKIRRLEEIGFKWALQEYAFEKGYQETSKYKEQFGDANAPVKYATNKGYPLGAWQHHQRCFYKNNTLDSNKIRMLQNIGFKWGMPKRNFTEEGIQASLKYKEKYGTPNALRNYKTPDGFKLGSWQYSQRVRYSKGKLTLDNVQRLQEIGFILDSSEIAFNKCFQETLIYKEQFGNPNAPKNYKTPRGYSLRYWQDRLRNYYRKGSLTVDMIKKLEKIGFIWALAQEEFEKNIDKIYHETVRYKKQFGTPNASISYKTPEGYQLYSWQGRLRDKYKKSVLPIEIINQFEKIGFIWDVRKRVFEDNFEQGFQETLKYKKLFGNTNAIKNYKTSDGYKLWSWQNSQRNLYKKRIRDEKGNLTFDMIRRLEGIGFKWALKK